MIAPPILTNEEHRLAALHRTYLLDTPQEAAFDLITRLVARLCGTKIAAISLVDRDRQWFKSRYGFTLEETSRVISFCAHAIEDTELFEIPDASQDKRFWTIPSWFKRPRFVSMWVFLCIQPMVIVWVPFVRSMIAPKPFLTDSATIYWFGKTSGTTYPLAHRVFGPVS